VDVEGVMWSSLTLGGMLEQGLTLDPSLPTKPLIKCSFDDDSTVIRQ